MAGVASAGDRESRDARVHRKVQGRGRSEAVGGATEGGMPKLEGKRAQAHNLELDIDISIAVDPLKDAAAPAWAGPRGGGRELGGALLATTDARTVDEDVSL